MVTFASIHRPADEVTVQMMQRDLIIGTPIHGESFTAARSKIDSTNKIQRSANAEIRALLPEGSYAMYL